MTLSPARRAVLTVPRRFFSAAVVVGLVMVLCGCTGTAPLGAPLQSTPPATPAESSAPPSPTPTAASGASQATADAAAACTGLNQAESNTDQGFTDALTEASQLAGQAAAADPAFQLLASNVAALAAIPLPAATSPRAETDAYAAAYLAVVDRCSDLGIHLPAD